MCVGVCVCVVSDTDELYIFLPEGCELSLCPIYKGVTNKPQFVVSLASPLQCCFLGDSHDILIHVLTSESEQQYSELKLLQGLDLLIHIYLLQPFFLCTAHGIFFLLGSPEIHKQIWEERNISEELSYYIIILLLSVTVENKGVLIKVKALVIVIMLNACGDRVNFSCFIQLSSMKCLFLS